MTDTVIMMLTLILEAIGMCKCVQNVRTYVCTNLRNDYITVHKCDMYVHIMYM